MVCIENGARTDFLPRKDCTAKHVAVSPRNPCPGVAGSVHDCLAARARRRRFSGGCFRQTDRKAGRQGIQTLHHRNVQRKRPYLRNLPPSPERLHHRSRRPRGAECAQKEAAPGDQESGSRKPDAGSNAHVIQHRERTPGERQRARRSAPGLDGARWFGVYDLEQLPGCRVGCFDHRRRYDSYRDDD